MICVCIFRCTVCLPSSFTFLTLQVTFPSSPLTQTSPLLILTLLSETPSQLPARLPEQQELLIHESKVARRREGKGKVGAEFFMVALQARMATTYRGEEASKSPPADN